MATPSKAKIGWAVVAVATILALLFFGVNYPLPEPPVDAPSGALAGASVNTLTQKIIQAENQLLSRGTLEVAGASAFGGALAFEGATANDYETTLTLTDPTADRTITLPNLTGTVMLTQNAGIMVLGVNTITTTLTISHGLTTPQAVFCTLIQDSEANAATCSATISGGTVVVKVWKADGATAGSVGKQVAWMVTGQP